MHQQDNLLHTHTDIQSQWNSFDFGFSETKYSHFLCFKVSIRTNKLVYSQTYKYTSRQQEIHDKIKSMKDSGMSYKRITKYLNENNILTHTGKRWGASGNSVHSVLKKYQMRLDRLDLAKKEYQSDWGKMEVSWEKNKDFL